MVCFTSFELYCMTSEIKLSKISKTIFKDFLSNCQSVWFHFFLRFLLLHDPLWNKGGFLVGWIIMRRKHSVARFLPLCSFFQLRKLFFNLTSKLWRNAIFCRAFIMPVKRERESKKERECVWEREEEREWEWVRLRVWN